MIDDFISDEDAAVSVDWIVLTAALAGTGLAVASTVRVGVDNAALQTSTALSGQAIRLAFGAEGCAGGIDGVQAAEDRRVAGSARDGIDVEAWRAENLVGLTDQALMHELRQARAALADGEAADATADATKVAIMRCELVLRGLG